MKKFITCLLTTVLLTGCASTTSTSSTNSSETSTTEQVTITNDVELAAVKTNLSGYKWVGDEIGDFEETSLKETIRLFDEKGSAVVYYGYVGCPWCERALPELNKVALKTGIKIYYVDASVSPASEDYQSLTGYLGDALSTDEETGEKEMYVPFVVGIKNGEVVGSHTALIDGFEIKDDSSQMSDSQKQELQDIYTDIIDKVAD